MVPTLLLVWVRGYRFLHLWTKVHPLACALVPAEPY